MRPFAIALLALLAGCAVAPESNRLPGGSPGGAEDHPFPPPPAGRWFNVTGKVTAINYTSITVDDLETGETTLPLKPQTTVRAALIRTFADIQPGHYVGTATTVDLDGRHRALSVAIRNEFTKFGQYTLAWARPTILTNGVVAAVTKSGDDIVLRVRHPAGETDVFVPSGMSLTSDYRTTVSLLKPGDEVTVNVFKAAADGDLSVGGIWLH